MMPAAPLVSNFSGAASRYKQNFTALYTLCDEVHVVRWGSAESLASLELFEAASPSAQKARGMASSWQDLNLQSDTPPLNRIGVFKKSVFKPISFQWPLAAFIVQALDRLVKDLEPDLIWAEHRDAAASCILLDTSTRWVYSHHDFVHRLRQFRHGRENARERWLQWTARRAEQQVIRNATVVVTGSSTEVQRLNDMGAKSARLVPVGYEDANTVSLELDAEADVRIVHLGSLETTANRVGLEAYLRTVHKQIGEACRKEGVMPDLYVIGDNRRVKPDLASLLAQSGIVCTGFVPDLNMALRPFDISILPYEHDSGYRTKLPLLFKHAQVVIATQASIAGTRLDGLEDVCVVLDRLADFPAVIARLVNDTQERKRLGRAAQAFFGEHFTYQAIQPAYASLLDELLAEGQP